MTDRIAEIEARLDRKREPCQDIYFDSWNWDQKKFHLHAEEDIAYLLAEVRRLREENDKLRELTAQELSWSTEAVENHKRAEAAEALALELADALGPFGNEGPASLIVDNEDYSILRERICDWFGQSDFRKAKSALSDNRLAKLREKKNG